MQRWTILVRGIVQGVGFRPFVYRLAQAHHLAGWVRNETGNVHIEVEGPPEALEHFLHELGNHPPPLAQVNEITCQSLPPLGESDFRILDSEAQHTGPIFIGPDLATCADCLRELFDPKDRRYRYPFLNCTNCGPRLTIIRSAPYDRERTTMTDFPLCDACRAEYDDPTNRRFHAQPTACPACGPHLSWYTPGGDSSPADPLQATVSALQQGKTVAIKGLGGYHLACDARQEEVVRTLRQRKHRDEKPFAIMVKDVDAARLLCEVSDDEANLLLSPQRPIVLLRRRPDSSLAGNIAPGNPCLGLMLPYTPLHHLLLRELEGCPLVMTSGNRSDEPIAYTDEDAYERLADIADHFLVHNRPIHLRCDDSVTRWMNKAELPIRRSRGYAPQPIVLPTPCRIPTLALGGQLKAVFALGRGRHALLSHHLGDLDHYQAYRAYTQAIGHYEDLFDIRPELIVHDLHPDYASTHYALERASKQADIQLLGVQHHHAHLASCLAEHGLDEPVIGVTFDGTGYGTDGTIWGGEFLVGDARSFQRAAHLRPVPMPGGEKAIREPWRMALAYLADAGEDDKVLQGRVPSPALRTVQHMLTRGLNAPWTTSAGRLFDAVAALVGLRHQVHHEGQAAIELEALASASTVQETYPFALEKIEPSGRSLVPRHWLTEEPPVLVVDTRPMIRAILDEMQADGKGCGLLPGLASTIARRFHATLAEMIARVCLSLRKQTGLNKVVLSGGVFLNVLLTEEVSRRLDTFAVYRHQHVPPNDGGLSLGQLAIAASRGCGL